MSADRTGSLVSALGERPDRAVAAAWLCGSWSDGARGRRPGGRILGLLLDPAVHGSPEQRLRVCRAIAGDLRGGPSGENGGFDGAGLELVVLNDVAPSVARRIVNEGRKLLSPRPEAERQLLREVQLRAADMEAFHRHSRRAVRSAAAAAR